MPMREPPVRIGVIGVGNMGQHHARVLADMLGVDFVGVADASCEQSVTVAKRHGVLAFTDYRELLDRVDAVSIAVPTRLHTDVGLACIEAGRHVLIEKPFAATPSEARLLADSASRARIVLQVGHIERFNPGFEVLQKVLYGRKVVALEARRLSPYSQRAADVGVVFDLMVHDLDLTVEVASSPVTKVVAAGNSAHTAALLTFDDGVVASLLASKVTHHKIRQFNVTCDDSFVSLNMLAGEIYIHRHRESTYVPDSAGILYQQDGVVERVLVPRREPLAAELAHFVSCVRGGLCPIVDSAAGIRAVELATQIEQFTLDPVPVQP